MEPLRGDKLFVVALCRLPPNLIRFTSGANFQLQSVFSNWFVAGVVSREGMRLGLGGLELWWLWPRVAKRGPTWPAAGRDLVLLVAGCSPELGVPF